MPQFTTYHHGMLWKKMSDADRKALTRGFVDGFLGAGCALASKPLATSHDYDVSVSKAWSDVGRAMSDAMGKERVRREQRRQQEILRR